MWPDDFALQGIGRGGPNLLRGGAVERTREEPGLVLNRLLTIEQAQRERTTGLVLSLSLGEHRPEQIDAVAQVLRRTPGSCPVFLSLVDGVGKRSLLRASSEFRINPQTVNKPDLEMILGLGRVEFSRQGTSR